MSEKINAYCSICGKGYYQCLACKDMMSLSPWKKHTCSAEHYKIYQTLRGFNTGKYTKDEAKSKLQMIDLSDFDNLRDNKKVVINEIMSTDEEMVEPIVKVETVSLSNEIDVSNKCIDGMSNEDVNNDPVVVKTRTIRKRKSFENIEDTKSSEIVETE